MCSYAAISKSASDLLNVLLQNRPRAHSCYFQAKVANFAFFGNLVFLSIGPKIIQGSPKSGSLVLG